MVKIADIKILNGSGKDLVMDQLITDICNANDCGSIREVLDFYSNISGFHGFAYTILALQPKVTTILACITNYPSEWLNYYHRKKYHLHDPVLSLVSHADQSFVWSEKILSVKLSDKSFLVMKEAGDYNIKNGLSVPINNFKGIFFHYLCTYIPDAMVRKKIMLMSHLATEQIQKIFNFSFPKKLTPRESECLTWTAAGKAKKLV